MQRSLPFVLMAFCLVVPLASAVADEGDAASLEDTPHITVVGTAATTAVPDQAEIRLGVTARAATAAEAWDEDAKRVKAVIDAAKSAGIKPQDIATAGVDLFQEDEVVHHPDGTARSEPKGFRASHQLRIKVSEVERVGSLVGALIAKGADTFGGVSFSVARPETIQDKLRADAVRDARHNAETTAAAAGVKLGRLLSVERPDRQVAVRPVARLRNAGPATMEMEPGTEILSAEVEASWAIE